MGNGKEGMQIVDCQAGCRLTMHPPKALNLHVLYYMYMYLQQKYTVGLVEMLSYVTYV